MNSGFVNAEMMVEGWANLLGFFFFFVCAFLGGFLF